MKFVSAVVAAAVVVTSMPCAEPSEPASGHIPVIFEAGSQEAGSRASLAPETRFDGGIARKVISSKHIGGRIMTQREVDDFYIKDVARGTGLSERRLETIEAGSDDVTRDEIRRLAKFFKVPQRFFIQRWWDSFPLRMRDTLNARGIQRISSVPKGAIPTAVALVLRKGSQGYKVLLAERAPGLYLEGFWTPPGGGRKKKPRLESISHAALRETKEEARIRLSKENILGRLNDALTITGKFLISPVVVLVRKNTLYRKSKEAPKGYWLPLNRLSEPNVFERIEKEKGVKVDPRTRMILGELNDVVQMANRVRSGGFALTPYLTTLSPAALLAWPLALSMRDISPEQMLLGCVVVWILGVTLIVFAPDIWTIFSSLTIKNIRCKISDAIKKLRHRAPPRPSSRMLRQGKGIASGDDVEATADQYFDEVWARVREDLRHGRSSFGDKVRDRLVLLTIKTDALRQRAIWMLENLGESLQLRRKLFFLLPIIEWMQRKFLIPTPADIDIATEIVENVIREKKNEGIDVAIDSIGDSALTEEEAEGHIEHYMSMMKDLKRWNPDFAIKLSAIVFEAWKQNDGQFVNKDKIKQVLKKLVRAARESGVSIVIDPEEYAYWHFTLGVYKEVIDELAKEDRSLVVCDGRGTLRMGLGIQAYLKDSEDTLSGLLVWGEANGYRMPVRLVKGAYDDKEKEWARTSKPPYPSPVFMEKESTDANFERLSEYLIKHHEHFKIAIASHNIRSIAKAMALAERYKLPKDEIEFQMLYGMGDAIKRAIVAMGYRVRAYVPVGSFIAGMKYAGRRLKELANKDNAITRTMACD